MELKDKLFLSQGTLYYGGPALLLLQTPEGHVLGALSTSSGRVWMQFDWMFKNVKT